MRGFNLRGIERDLVWAGAGVEVSVGKSTYGVQ